MLKCEASKVVDVFSTYIRGLALLSSELSTGSMELKCEVLLAGHVHCCRVRRYSSPTAALTLALLLFINSSFSWCDEIFKRWALLQTSLTRDTCLTDLWAMALASAPSTPQRVVPQPSIRRSFTAPIRSSTSKFPISQEILDDSETLFAHSACKIVSFSTSRIFVRRHSIVSNGRPDSQEEPIGTLPWASTTERTIAAGQLQTLFLLQISAIDRYV